MTSVLKTYQHSDTYLPLFNGCNNNYSKVIESVFEKEQFVKTKDLIKFKNGIVIEENSILKLPDLANTLNLI